jgi:hypothetical protein
LASKKALKPLTSEVWLWLSATSWNGREVVCHRNRAKEMAEEAGDGLGISFNKHRSISDKNSRLTMNVGRCLAFPDATIYTIHCRTKGPPPDPT